MMTLLVAFSTLVAMTAAQASHVVPELFTNKQFNAVDLAQAANHYIGLGEAEAIKALKALEEDHSKAIDRGFHTNERIGWICRIVFQGADGRPLRAPRYGGLSLPYLTMPLDQWPLYPVAESDSVFFVLSEGYMLAGVAERAADYIDYCSTTGVFRKTKVEVPSHDKAVKAFNTLKTAKRWTMIKWTDEGPGTKYKMSEEWVLRDIEVQATSIPEK